MIRRGLVRLTWALAAFFGLVPLRALATTCTAGVRARIDTGAVCGVRRTAASGEQFASFKGLPYAIQPVGELRFKELEPLRRWKGIYEATEEGPPCPQHDVLYGKLIPGLNQPNMTEACIYANVHVPLQALPSFAESQLRLPRNIQPPYTVGEDQTVHETNNTGLPILVFIHGGGFAFGSGSEVLHGPEYLIKENVIVITFNYRLNVFGFLSLNSASMPGNNGLRDMITLLRWVQRNARAFGGNPNDVTLAGQSAGATAAHMLTLSPAAKGLFKRVILMSGTALPSFFATAPAYAHTVSTMFLSALGITATDPEEVHNQLVLMPLKKIMKANKFLQDQFGLTVFVPVVETPHEGVTVILDQDPELSIAQGRGDNIPLLVGYTTNECEVFRRIFKEFDILEKVKENPLILLPPEMVFTKPPQVAMELAKKVAKRYFGDRPPTEDEYIHQCSESYFEYPALELARYKYEMMKKQSAPMYLYEFGYQPEHSVLKEALNLEYTGAAHIEDLAFIFNVSSVSVSSTFRDTDVRTLIVKFFTNFILYGNPSGFSGALSTNNEEWRAVDSITPYMKISSPSPHQAIISPRQVDILAFFDIIHSAS